MASVPLIDDEITLPRGVRLGLRRAEGSRRPFLLVHGLASNARLWDGVNRELATAGHEVVAVDLRGHGRSNEPPGGYDTETAAADLAALCRQLRWTNGRAPVVAGQSWGGNVALTLAAEHGGVAALALVDGGWLRLAEHFPTFEDCWAQLAPPRFDGLTMAELVDRSKQWFDGWSDDARDAMLAGFIELPDGTVRARLSREHHRSILHSIWAGDPRVAYPRVNVPVLLAPALGTVPDAHDRAKRASVAEAAAALADATVVEYVDAHHDLHAQHPERLAGDLLALAARIES